MELRNYFEGPININLTELGASKKLAEKAYERQEMPSKSEFKESAMYLKTALVDSQQVIQLMQQGHTDRAYLILQ